MSPRARAYFELVRAPNLFTAPPDVIAGAAVSGVLAGIGSVEAALPLGLVGVASMSFYAGGVALNDVIDAPVDARERPERPIPSGRVARSAALRISIEHLALGLGLLALVGLRPLGCGVILVATIIAYNLLKRGCFGPMLMGLCRGLNLLLGASPGAPFSFNTPFLHQAATLYSAACLGLFVAGLTAVARHETPGSRRFAVLPGLLTMLGAVGLLALHPGWRGGAEFHYLLPITFLAAGVILLGTTVILKPSVIFLRRGVGFFLALIVVLDATLVLSGAGEMGFLAVLLFLLPYAFLMRRFSPT